MSGFWRQPPKMFGGRFFWRQSRTGPVQLFGGRSTGNKMTSPPKNLVGLMTKAQPLRRVPSSTHRPNDGNSNKQTNKSMASSCHKQGLHLLSWPELSTLPQASITNCCLYYALTDQQIPQIAWRPIIVHHHSCASQKHIVSTFQEFAATQICK